MPPQPPRLTRRLFVGGAAASLAVGAPLPIREALAAAGIGDHPFRLGVASGEPAADGFVIWTRLAPRPNEGGGMPARPYAVRWEVALDPAMRRVVRRGRAIARPEAGHAVHVEIGGLAPQRPYWYRFRLGPEASTIGRAVTAPRPGAPFALMRFAFASCQHWEQGYYTAYRHMIADLPDLIVHLGDYIYEVGNWTRDPSVRRHGAGEPKTLAAYRNRYALYRTDPDLQAAHAWCPWVCVWDDHEVDNDYAADQSEQRDDPALFLQRRAAAYQAYYEHMPLRRANRPRGAHMPLYRRRTFGNLLTFHLLDGRQYRSDQPCRPGPRRGGGSRVVGCDERLAADRTMLGAAQEAWLQRGLSASRTHWNVLAQQLLIAELKQTLPDGRVAFWTDGWDGYAAARARLIGYLDRARIRNPVTIGGDIHSFWVTDLKTNFDRPDAKTVATEFVGTSISSAGVPYEPFRRFLPANPHVRFFESRYRGYVLCDVTPNHWLADLRAVDQLRDRKGTARTLRSYYVESGRPGAHRR
jgi:alkaline phosphatase D